MVIIDFWKFSAHFFKFSDNLNFVETFWFFFFFAAADVENKDKIADLLIAHGANLNAMDTRGRTPLMVAFEKGKFY